MAKFEVTVAWTERYCGTREINANSLEEAIAIANNRKDDLREEITEDSHLGGYQDRDEPEVIDVSKKED